MARNSFASAFSNAFLQQSQLAIQNQRQAELDARQRVLWDREDKRYEDEQSKQAQVDEQLANLRKINSSGRVGAGLSMPSASFEAPQQAAEGFAAPAQLGRGLTVGDAATGFDAPVLNAQGRAARDSDVEAILGNVAAIKGDVAGLRASRQAMKTAKYDEMVADKIAWWRDLPPEEKAKAIAEHSQRSDIQGYGVYKPGTGKMSGYMIYMGPDGTPIKLNEREVEALISFGAAAEVDPVRARADLEKTSDKVRAIALQQFQAQTQGVQVNNTAAHYANQDELGRARRSIAQSELGLRRQQLDREDNQVLGATEDGRGLILLDRKSGATRVAPAAEGVDFNKLFPKVTGQRPGKPAYTEADVAKYATALVGQPILTPDGKQTKGPDGKPRVYDVLSARRAALAELTGEGAPDGFAIDIPADKLKDAMLKSREAPQQAAPAARRAAAPAVSGVQPIRGGGAIYNGRRYPTLQAAREAEAAEREAERNRPTVPRPLPLGLGTGTFGIE